MTPKRFLDDQHDPHTAAAAIFALIATAPADAAIPKWGLAVYPSAGSIEKMQLLRLDCANFISLRTDVMGLHADVLYFDVQAHVAFLHIDALLRPDLPLVIPPTFTPIEWAETFEGAP